MEIVFRAINYNTTDEKEMSRLQAVLDQLEIRERGDKKKKQMVLLNARPS